MKSPSSTFIIIATCDYKNLVEPLVVHLQKADIEASIVGTQDELAALAPLTKFPVMLIDDSIPEANDFAAFKRELGNADMLTVLLVGQSRTKNERLAAYRSGITICVNKEIDPQELAMLVINLASLRHGSIIQAVAGNGEWMLTKNGRELTAPNGFMIKVTFKEFEVLNMLISSWPKPALKEDLLDELNYKHDIKGEKALEAVIHRIRSKTSSMGEGTLIDTAHGIGWALSSGIRVV